MDNNIVGKNIKEQLAKHEMSGSELAQRLGVSKSIVSEWLSGKKIPRMDKVEAMCQLFRCKRSAILVEENEIELDALSEDIINRFNSLTNSQKISAYKSFDEVLSFYEREV